ncbi:hypothetical protein CC78DRAFT_586295, partial [Lojkania enalia]
MSKKRLAGNDELLAYSEPKKPKIKVSKSVLTEGFQQNLPNEDYTVGWICAIATEYVIAQAFLDEKHDRPEYVHPQDDNDYTLGRIGKYNVVVAVLPDGEYGTCSAAGVAMDMLHSFPNIRIALMVGIGGGAPTPKHDIRLGDIVVSTPYNGKGGVFQYNFEKTIQDQSFRPTGFLSQPPKVLRTAINGLKAQYESDGHQLNEAINSILEEKPRLQKIIRGICDYSDTHKNTEWQGYAAMVAAAYANDILRRIAPSKIEAEKKISNLLLSEKDISELRCGVQDARSAVRDISFKQRRRDIKRWISPSDPSTNYNKALQQRQEGTGLWFLQSPAYVQWKTQPNSSLWLYGIPGCGKTILSSTIIEDLDKAIPRSTLLYFYFDFSDVHKQTLDGMIRSLISQLSPKNESAWKQLASLFSCDDGRRQPRCESLCQVLSQMLDPLENVYIVLGALDECRTRTGSHTEGLLSWIRGLLGSGQRNVHLLVTSRPERDIQSKLSDVVDEENIIPLQGGFISRDICAYIHNRVRKGGSLRRWRTQPEVQDEIETTLMRNANGMFRWAACQIDALEHCLDYRTLRNALASLPKTLDETYGRILRAIPLENKQYAIIILQLITFSERPLRIEEAIDAIAVDIKEDPHFCPKYRTPNPQEISRYCSSLVAVVPVTEHSNGKYKNYVELQLIHFSVKEYLMSNRLDSDIAPDFQKTTASTAIAKTCLAYLLHFNQEIPSRDILPRFPFAQYSARFWMTNAAGAKDTDKIVLDFIERLFCYQKCAYRICYSLYRPDQPWSDGPYEGGEAPASALYYAALGGLLWTVNCLLNRGTDVNAQGGFYGNALQAASEGGHEQIVRLLVDKGADVNAQGGFYGNALQAASFRGHEQIVRLLVDLGADVNAQ